MMFDLRKSTRKGKKFMITIDNKKIHFGASPYEDYTKHHDENRKKLYLNRHRKRETWTKKGINTAGFWSRWILWNKKSISESLQDIENKFNIQVKDSTQKI
jgi:hypothetical protein